MSKPTRICLSVALALAPLSALALPALANSYSSRDPRDVSNSTALDIVSVRTGHRGARLLQAATLEDRFSSQDLARVDGFIDFLISTDGDFSDFERRVYIYGGARFRAFVTNGSGRELIGRARVYRPNDKTVGALISPGLLGDPDGYHWFAVAVMDGPRRCCIDYAPDDYWLIHDLTSPVVDSVMFGDTSTTTVPASTVPITWHATDSGFAGLAYWSVRQREDGTTTWLDVDSGKFGLRPRRFDATKTTDLAAGQGRTYEACVSVYDWAANRTTSGRFDFAVPYDDANPAVFAYGGTTDTTQGTGTDFDGTLTLLTNNGGTVTITVPVGLQTSLVVRSGFDGTADVTVNGSPAGSIDESTAAAGSRVLFPLPDTSSFGTSGTGTDTIVLTKTGGTSLAIDGYLGAPAYVGAAAYGGCGGPPTLPRAGVAREVALAAAARVSSTVLERPALTRRRA